MSRAASPIVNFPPSRPVFSIFSNVPSPLFRNTRFGSPALPMTRSGKPSSSRSAHIAETPQPQATTPERSVTSSNVPSPAVPEEARAVRERLRAPRLPPLRGALHLLDEDEVEVAVAVEVRERGAAAHRGDQLARP